MLTRTMIAPAEREISSLRVLEPRLQPDNLVFFPARPVPPCMTSDNNPDTLSMSIKDFKELTGKLPLSAFDLNQWGRRKR